MGEHRPVLGVRFPVVAMVHVGALPGTPGSREPIDALAERAAIEASQLRRAGADAVVIENMHDRPYLMSGHGPEVVSAMTAVGLAVRQAVGDMPLGVQILARANREALAVALAIGARFVRAENFVFSHVADEGLMIEAEAGALLRYRRRIGAECVQIWADIKKKHSSHAITGDVSLAETAAAADFATADTLVVTGSATGEPTAPADVDEARGGVGLPVIAGSGADESNVAEMVGCADGVIIGSALKADGRWENPVDSDRAERIIGAFRAAR